MPDAPVSGLLGFHVTCDGIAPPERADQWTQTAIHEWCMAAIEESGLTCIFGPAVSEHDGQLVGFAIIAESHIAIHLRPESGICYAELFSCRAFDEERFARMTADRFGLTRFGSSSSRRNAAAVGAAAQ